MCPHLLLIILRNRGNNKGTKYPESEYKMYTRKATFKKVNGYFIPVNKRAKYVAKKLHKRTRISQADLNNTKGKGTYTFYQYTKTGTLKAI